MSGAQQLLLFVAGDDPATRHLVARLRELRDDGPGTGIELEVIDLELHPDLAAEFKILSIPTLIKRSPQPAQRFVGDLADLDRLRRLLGITDRGGDGLG